MTPLLPVDFTQPSLQIILRINLDGTVRTASKKSGMRTNRKNRIKIARRSNCADKSSQRVKIVRLCPLAIL